MKFMLWFDFLNAKKKKNSLAEIHHQHAKEFDD